MNFPPNYVWPVDIIPNPKAGRSSHDTSSVSLGKAAKIGIDMVNEELPSAEKLPIEVKAPKTLSNQILASMGGILSRDPLFRNHITKRSYQEVQQVVSRRDCLEARDRCIEELYKRQPLTKASKRGWMAQKALVNNLAFEKNALRQKGRKLGEENAFRGVATKAAASRMRSRNRLLERNDRPHQTSKPADIRQLAAENKMGIVESSDSCDDIAPSRTGKSKKKKCVPVSGSRTKKPPKSKSKSLRKNSSAVGRKKELNTKKPVENLDIRPTDVTSEESDDYKALSTHNYQGSGKRKKPLKRLIQESDSQNSFPETGNKRKRLAGNVMEESSGQSD